MTRNSLKRILSLTVLISVAACSGSGNNSGNGGQGSTASVGARPGFTSLGGNASALGGAGNAGSDGVSDLGGIGSLGGNGAAGNNSTPGSVGGGANGGEGPSVTATGGAETRDIVNTGGTGVSQDVQTGGSGHSQDIGTGGGESIDMPTGGGHSVDLTTGGAPSIDLATGGAPSIDLGTGGAPPTIDLGCVETTLTKINVYVIKDATPTGADTEGNMYVGGDLIAKGSYTVGAKDTTTCQDGIYSLVVGGNVTIKAGSVHGGKAVYGGTDADISAVSFDCGVSRGSPIDFVQLEAQVKALSTKMQSLNSNGTVTEGSNSLVFKGTNPSLNVFNIDAAQANNVTIDVPKTSTVVINVSGDTVAWPGSKMTLPGDYRTGDDYEFATHVIWNFYEATSITIGGVAFQGSVLAPYATIGTKSGGHIAGQVIVEYLKGGTEYHPYYFSGCIEWNKL